MNELLILRTLDCTSSNSLIIFKWCPIVQGYVETAKYRIETKDLDIEVEAESKEEAIRNFFKLLKLFWKDWKRKVGQIAIVYDEGKAYPFRTLPSIYNMGLMDEDLAVANLLRIFDEPPTPKTISEARIMLYILADQDRWMTEGV